MNRRSFLKLSSTSAAIAVLPPSLLFTGCSVAQVVLDVEGVLKEAAAITQNAGQTAWSAELTQAADALQAAYSVWDQSTTSTTGQKIAALLNALVATTAIILPNDPWSALINEMVALADLALSFWPGSTSVTYSRNPHVGAVLPPVSYKDAKRRWNTLAVGPLAGAKIK